MDLCIEANLTTSEVIAEQLKSDIQNLGLEPGAKLQSLRDLAVKYKTSYLTMRKAVGFLCDEGMLCSRRGAGVYVASSYSEELSSSTKEKDIIAMIFCGLGQHVTTDRLYNKLIYGIEKQAESKNCEVVVSFLRNSQAFKESNVYKDAKAFLMIGDDSVEGLEDLFEDKVVVWVMGSSRPWGDVVSYDNSAVGKMVAKEFVSKGHKNLAYVNVDSVVGKERCESFEVYAKALGANVTAFDDPNVMTLGRFEAEIDQKAVMSWATQIANMNPRPTAVFTVDTVALMLHNALVESGLKPGKDIEIACCNWRDLAPGIMYQPFEVDIHPEEVGAAAVRHLRWRLDNLDHQSLTIKIEPTLR